MNKKGTNWFAFFLVFVFVAAAVLWAYGKGYVPGGFVNNNTLIENESTKTCELCEFPEINKAAVYFNDDTNKGMNHFIDNTGSMLYCAFNKLENHDFAERLVSLQKTGKDVKVYFGVDETMKNCEIVCIPKIESQYNYLLGEQIPVDFGRSDFNFCINEKAVYLFSSAPGAGINQNHGLIIFSPDLKRKYEEYFNSIFT